MNLNQTLSLVRAVLLAAGTTVINQGWADEQLWESVVGGGVALTAIVWSILHHGKKNNTNDGSRAP